MNILVCSKDDLVANLMLNRLLPMLAGHRVGVLLANRPRAKASSEPSLARLKLLEEDLPRRVLFPLADAASAPGALLSFGWLARRQGLHLLPAEGLDQAGRSALIDGFAPDLILCLKYGYRLTAEDIARPRCGAFNLHSGRLPERPGLHAIFWAMRAGEPAATCSLHRVAVGIDSGALVDRCDVPIRPGASFFRTMLEVYEVGAQRMGRLAQAVAAGTPLRETPQPSGDWPMLGLPNEADIAAFEAAGGVWIDPADYLDLAAHYVPRR